MISRYPHTASVTIETVSDDPIPVVSKETLNIKGRYEPAPSNKNLNYSGKYYCHKLEVLEDDPNALNGKKLTVLGRETGISRAWNYQTHCEIWLD